MNHNNSAQLSAKEIFILAVELKSVAERKALVDQHCGTDPELKKQVQRLLAAADKEHTKSPLDAIVDAFGPEETGGKPGSDRRAQLTLDMNATKAMSSITVGGQIGRYRLMEQIGEGGMGVVYVAEQVEPVRRKVALKVIKPGMDSKQVIARFEAERQALALMDHGNIARVLDAGTTELGLPYFVMELVRGLTITQYCDKAKANIRQRLELFIAVCNAVHHAHQKGIIHRDIKPGNVLVTLHDGKPVVKVIDFGVAKALHQQLSQHTVYTALNQVVGTPLYMSPEQLELSGLDIDTRTDIYSLGVLLYEMLTGFTPFDRDRLLKSGFDEMRRIIREEEPPRPSQRITTLPKAELSTVANKRGLDDRAFTRSTQSELDWITLMALEKDRNRRYESASAFAADVQRYLNNEQVQACPPTVLYRLSKLCRRYRGPMVTAAALALVLVMATGVSLSYALQANEEKNKAIQSEQLAEKRLKQSRADFDLALKSLETIIQSVSSSEFAQLPGVDPVREDILNCAMRFFQEIIDKHDNDPWARMKQALAHNQIVKLYEGRGDSAAILRETDESIRILESVIAENPEVLQFQQSLMYPLFTRLHSVLRTVPQRHADAERCLQIVRKCTEAGLMKEPETLALLYYKVAETLPDNKERAREFVETSIQTSESHGLPPLPPTQIWLAERARDEGDLESAVRWYRRGIELYDAQAAEATGGSTIVPRWLSSLDTAKLAAIHEQLNQPKEAEESWNKAFNTARQLNREFSADARAWQSLIDRTSELCGCLKSEGRLAEAAKLISDVLPELTAPSESTVGIILLQAELLESLQDFEGALAIYEKAVEDSPDAGSVHVALGWFLGHTPRFSLRNDDRAMQHLQKAVELEPRNLRALGALAEQYIVKVKDYDKAMQLVERVLELNPDDAWGFLNRAEIHSARGAFELAKLDVDRAIELSPTVWTYFSRGRLHAKIGNYELALADFDQATATDPNVANVYADRGTLHKDRGAFDLALADFSKVIELTPNIADFYNRRASIYFELRNFPESIADLTRAMELKPSYFALLNSIPAERLLTHGDSEYHDGIKLLADRCVELNKESAASLIARAQLLAGLGELQRANEDLKKSSSLSNRSYYEQYQVALLSAKLKSQELYKAECQSLVESTTPAAKPIAKHFAAWVCALATNAVEDYTAAITLSRAAVEAEPTNPQFQNGLGAILMRAGMYVEAKRYLAGIDNSAESEATSKSYKHYFLALTEHHLGQADVARVQLKFASELSDSELAESVPWTRRLTIELLRAEAQALILGEDPSGN